MGVQALEPASQISGGNAVPGSVKKTCGCGFVLNLMVLAFSLDSVVLEVFSNLNNSMIQLLQKK